MTIPQKCKVQLLFSKDGFTKRIDVAVPYNSCMKESDVVKTALKVYYDSLPGDFPELTLEKNGKEKIVSDDNQRGFKWLKKLMASYAIVERDLIRE